MNKNITLNKEVSQEERKVEIQDAVDAIPDLQPDDMATLCTKINQAVMMGQLVLTTQELAASKLLSGKYIPDAPRHVTLQASVRTESILIGWLELNSQKKVDALSITGEYKVLEDAGNIALADAGFELD